MTLSRRQFMSLLGLATVIPLGIAFPKLPRTFDVPPWNDFKRDVEVHVLDRWGNDWNLEPRLVLDDVGFEPEGTWWIHGWFYRRVGGPGIGGFGDVEAYVELWDARKIEVPGVFGRMFWGISRVGDERFTMSIRGRNVVEWQREIGQSNMLGFAQGEYLLG